MMKRTMIELIKKKSSSNCIAQYQISHCRLVGENGREKCWLFNAFGLHLIWIHSLVIHRIKDFKHPSTIKSAQNGKF